MKREGEKHFNLKELINRDEAYNEALRSNQLPFYVSKKCPSQSSCKEIGTENHLHLKSHDKNMERVKILFSSESLFLERFPSATNEELGI
jgi:hypothetical protein